MSNCAVQHCALSFVGGTSTHTVAVTMNWEYEMPFSEEGAAILANSEAGEKERTNKALLQTLLLMTGPLFFFSVGNRRESTMSECMCMCVLKSFRCAKMHL